MNFNQAEFITSYGLSSQLPASTHLEIAFAGRSNVGKSSAINKLFNRKGLARVSAVPGKTATINFYRAGDVHFVDLPGYGYAKVAKSEKERWALLMEKYFNDERNLAIVIQLVDMRHPPSKLDIDMIEYLIEGGFPFLILLTKCDKLNKTQTAQRLEKIVDEIPSGDEIKMIPFSSQTGEGLDELKEVLEELCAHASEVAEEIANLDAQEPEESGMEESLQELEMLEE